jgi:SPP1 family predicted phage head-tail adaptor
VDAAGQGFDTWEAWATVWANVRRVSARDYDSAGQPQASGLVSIVIRCRDGIEPGMRVLCDGQAWDIVGDPVAMSAGLLRFEAASGVRDAV